MADVKPGGNKKRPQIKFSMYWMYAFILLFLFGMVYLDDNSVTKKVSYSEFENYITDSINARSHGITKITLTRRKVRPKPSFRIRWHVRCFIKANTRKGWWPI